MKDMAWRGNVKAKNGRRIQCKPKMPKEMDEEGISRVIDTTKYINVVCNGKWRNEGR